MNTFTNDPQNSDRDLVRILVSDTDTDNAKLSDETIAWALAEKPSALLAAALLADTLAGTYRGEATKKQVGDLALWYDSQATEYRTLASRLRLQAVSTVRPFTGGISVSRKASERSDTDWDRPAFSRAMHDNPSGSSTSTGW